MSLPTFIPAPPRKYRERKLSGSSTTPVGPLALVSATYLESSTITLVFNQPIDIAGFDGTSIVVSDGDLGVVYDASGEVDQGPSNTLVCGLVEIATGVGGSLTLTVSGGNGIRTVAGMIEWSGIGTTVLPIP